MASVNAVTPSPISKVDYNSEVAPKLQVPPVDPENYPSNVLPGMPMSVIEKSFSPSIANLDYRVGRGSSSTDAFMANNRSVGSGYNTPAMLAAGIGDVKKWHNPLTTVANPEFESDRRNAERMGGLTPPGKAVYACIEGVCTAMPTGYHPHPARQPLEVYQDSTCNSRCSPPAPQIKNDSQQTDLTSFKEGLEGTTTPAPTPGAGGASTSTMYGGHPIGTMLALGAGAMLMIHMLRR